MKNLELERKAVHAGFGIIYLLLYLHLEKDLFYTIHALFFAVTAFSITCMISAKKIFIGKLGRKNDVIPGVGGLMYMIGLSCVLIADAYLDIPNYINIASIVTLVIGDPIASITGKLLKPLGRIKILEKSLFASIIAWIISCFVATIFCFIKDYTLNGNILMIVVGNGLLFELLLGYSRIRKKMNGLCIDNALIPMVVVFTGILIN